MFLFKKIVAPFFFPLPFCLGLFFLGLILYRFTRRKTTGKILAFLGMILLLLLSYDGISNRLLRPLEEKYPPLRDTQKIPAVKWIVVLGGGHTSDPRLPATSQLGEAALARLVEGIRLQRSVPGSKLVLSGGAVFDPVPEAKVMAEAAAALGVEKKDLVLETGSKDTEDEARIIQGIVKKDPFLLVTSAAHMPRSMGLFEKKGMRPVAAPTDYGVKEQPEKAVSPGMFFPQISELQKTESAIYEYLGLTWAKLRGRV